jgi:hypothetical protein
MYYIIHSSVVTSPWGRWFIAEICTRVKICVLTCNFVTFIRMLVYIKDNVRHLYTRADHLIPGLIFFRGSYKTQRSGKKSGQVANLCKCTCVTGSRYLPAFALRKPLSERLPAVCVASHDGGESSAACMHQFLYVKLYCLMLGSS